MLRDSFGRVHDYLRISLTDKCNLRCTYCMPENPSFMQDKSLMNDEELLGISKVFVEQLGINKIRLTGGEPTIRKNFDGLLLELAKLPVKLALTTNGILLDKHIDAIVASKMSSINISLDTLDEEKFLRLTRRSHYKQVLDNIFLAVDRGLKVKVNVVVMRGENEDEVLDFVRMTSQLPLHVRFIEYMPFDGNRWAWNKVVNAADMLANVQSEFKVEKLNDDAHSTSRAYRVINGKGTFAFISTVSNPFCEGCNRIRLTAEGKIRNCLFGTREWDLLAAYRLGENIVPLIQDAIDKKEAARGGLPEFNNREALEKTLSSRPMVKIGG